MAKRNTCDIEDRTDHLGMVFKSGADMCKYWNIKRSTFLGRLARGWTKEKALTIPTGAIKSILSDEDRTDHLGMVFESQKMMCRYWNMSETEYIDRRNSGKSKREALTTESGSIRLKKSRTDHLGKTFNSKDDMCKYWNIPVGTYTARIYAGWSKEKALTAPVQKKLKEYIDPVTGCIYYGPNDISKIYGVKKDNFVDRLQKSNNIIRALGISPWIQKRSSIINKKKYNLLISKRIKKGKDVFECYIDNGDGTSTFKIMSYDMIDQYCLEQYKIYNNII